MTKSRLLIVVFFALVIADQTQAQSTISVRYRTADTIYLDAGTVAGLRVGEQLEVMRGSNVVGVIEIIFTAERSSSARVVSQAGEIREGDLVRRRGSTDIPRQTPPPLVTEEMAPPTPRAMSLSGTASVDFESNSAGDGAHDATRSLGRLSLRLRDIAGLPLQLRVRLRASDTTRDGDSLSSSLPRDDQRNRFYEMALSYEPRGGRWAAQAGRFGGSPLLGVGYLDGLLARGRITRGLEVGGFAGFVPDLEEVALSTDATKFGVFARIAPSSERVPWDLTIAAGREGGEESGSREYVSVDGRYDAGGTFALFGHTEAGTNEEAVQGVNPIYAPRLNIAWSGIARLAADRRVAVSFEHIESRQTDEARTLEARYDEFLRQGLRASFESGSPSRFHFAMGGGVRSGTNYVATTDLEEDIGQTYSAFVSTGHGDVAGLSIGVNASVFQSDVLDGGFASLRVARQFEAGHLVEVAAGTFIAGELSQERQDATVWTRGGVWFELPGSFFVRGEIEITFADDMTGQRFSAGAGRRF